MARKLITGTLAHLEVGAGSVLRVRLSAEGRHPSFGEPIYLPPEGCQVLVNGAPSNCPRLVSWAYLCQGEVAVELVLDGARHGAACEARFRELPPPAEKTGRAA
jgi:hypothetical protein